MVLGATAKVLHHSARGMGCLGPQLGPTPVCISESPMMSTSPTTESAAKAHPRLLIVGLQQLERNVHQTVGAVCPGHQVVRGPARSA